VSYFLWTVSRCQSFAQTCISFTETLTNKNLQRCNSGSSLFLSWFLNQLLFAVLPTFLARRRWTSYHGPRDSRRGSTCSSGIFTYLVFPLLVQLMVFVLSFNLGLMFCSNYWHFWLCFTEQVLGYCGLLFLGKWKPFCMEQYAYDRRLLCHSVPGMCLKLKLRWWFDWYQCVVALYMHFRCKSVSLLLCFILNETIIQ
jgi:hypothetical protein